MTKNEEGVNTELERVNQKMENVDKSLEELKVLMSNIQMNTGGTSTPPRRIVSTVSPVTIT